jgi:hypothetical protein
MSRAGEGSATGKISPPLPLVIAVAGHRDLIEEDKARLRKQVDAIFDELDRLCPCCRPFQILSALAEGADRLVAHVALKRHAHLVACLPMERSVYEMDFPTRESRNEFNALLGKATHIETVPWIDGNAPGLMHEQWRRDSQYEALGKSLVSNCHVLIALWDGAETQLRGGTCSVVALQRYGRFGKSEIDLHHPLDFPEAGPVYHVLTPRHKNPAPAGDLDRWQLLYHSGFKTTKTARTHFNQIFRRMSAFNKDALNDFKRHKERQLQCAKWLIPAKSRKELPVEMQMLVDRFAVADSLALSFQQCTKVALWLLIFACGLSGVFLFELFAHGPEKYRGAFLCAYLAIIVIAYLVYRMASFREFKTRHLDYRALAEGLRLQIFWKLSGLPDLVVDHYLSKQRSELDWVRDAIRRWTRPVVPISTKQPDWSLVGQHWLQNQFAFFARAARRNRKRHDLEVVCYWTFLGMLGATVVAILFAQLPTSPALPEYFHNTWRWGMDGHGLLVIAMTMLPALAGAITAYSLKMAFSEQRKQYQRMGDLYERALLGFETILRMNTPDKDQLIQNLVKDLGREALSENGDWVLLHRERMVEMFVGG